MATQQSATVQITNKTDGNAWILLFHNNSSNNTQSGSWTATPGQTVGPLTVYFETGFGTWDIEDYWSVLLLVQDGSTPGFYVSSGTELDPYWKECQLQHKDAGQTLTFAVDSTTFDVNLDSGGCTGGMQKIAPVIATTPPLPLITNVFVVMLENHSLDNMFAMAGIQGLTVATTGDSNSYDNVTYNVQSSAPLSMPTDPGHEFPDVLQQLAGTGATYTPGGTYPTVVNTGFAANYATSTTEGPVPPTSDIGDIMACFATSTQLPNIYQLATQFGICGQWFSSMPGPTWPNRFFLHGASSSGLDASPSLAQEATWETPGDGVQYPNGSIYKTLAGAGIPYRFYNDSTGAPSFLSLYSDDPDNGSLLGAVPQVTALSGVTILDFHSLSNLSSDLAGPYPYPYTFIEPHYGDPATTYEGGSSQHPMDDVYGGETLLNAVYSAIRNSPYWNTSLLIVVYDEHGGFYDSVAPGSATAPGDNPTYGYSVYGFTFEQYGVRVPAVIASPLVPAGTVDDTTTYDHSSVLATLEQLWGLKPLTQRDTNASSILSLLSETTPRTDCPTSLGQAAPPKAARPRWTPEERARLDALPLPKSGNLIGTLLNLKKAEIELSMGTPAEIAAIAARFAAIRTRGDARAYAREVMTKVGIAQQQRQLARPRAR